MMMLIASASLGRADRLKFIAVTFLSGLFIWMFIEYGMHRFIFHRPERGKWWTFLPWVHGMHHENPRDVRLIISPVWFSLPISAPVWLILWLLTGDWHTSVLLI